MHTLARSLLRCFSLATLLFLLKLAVFGRFRLHAAVFAYLPPVSFLMLFVECVSLLRAIHCLATSPFVNVGVLAFESGS